MDKKKLAYFIWQHPNPGETFIEREITGMRELGIDLSVFSFQNHKSPLPAIFIKPLCFLKWTAKAFCALWKKPGRLLQFLRNLPLAFSYGKECHTKGINIIHAHFANAPAELAMAAADTFGLEFSFTAHAYDIFGPDSSLWMKEKIKRAKQIITCTAYNRNYLSERYCHKDIHLNYHTLNIYENTEPKKGYILAGGRFVEKKGFPVLLESLHILKEMEGFNCPAIFFGDGPLLDKCKKLADDYGLSEITFMENIANDKVITLMQGADIFIHSGIIAENGDRDGIPNTILEAMSCGTPVIASGICSITEVIKNNENGWTIPASDPPALAKAIKNGLNSPERLQEFAQKGQDLIKNMFSPERNIRELAEIIFS